ncbi:uncharacterized protein LOC123539470 isoform X1 [Mercenaria mercenaria]|uniref:uncharacterized protein LOC123539470 isoform X1 n=1 Tax=Mercenaria mercenaria TaxID=6596 RepID=UPI00234EB498|nr:uncharacterized protein LOC123539470 isoform X1 [Mercenaria mercenaria]
MNKILYSGIIVCLLLSSAKGTGQSCEDIDHDACVAMATQNANLCSDPVLAKSACPHYCNNCPMTCYSCNTTVPDITLCNTVTCSNNEICMWKEVTRLDHRNHHYVFGCATKAYCNDERKRDIHSRSIVINCCLNDLCNKPVPTTTMSATSTTRITTPPFPVCPRDIIVMVDHSDAGVAYYPEIKSFLSDLVKTMRIGPNNTKVSLASFGRMYTHIEWLLDRKNNTKQSLLNAIQQFQPYSRRLSPNDIANNINPVSHLVLNTHIHLSERDGNRPQFPNIVILITASGVGHGSLNTTITWANGLHKKYNQTVTIGIGNTDHRQLEIIATDTRHAFFVDSGKDLPSLEHQVMNLICS